MSHSGIHTIRRRKYLVAVGAVVGSASLAGCSGNVDGTVDETVTSGEEKFQFDAEEGDTINIYINKRDGPATVAILHAPLGARAAIEEIESAKTFSHAVARRSTTRRGVLSTIAGKDSVRNRVRSY